MAPKDIARSYPKRGLTADVGFRSEPKFCGDGSTSLNGTSDYLESTLTTALGSGFSVSLWFLKRTTTGSNNYLWSSGSAGPGGFISLSCTSTNALAVYDLSLFLTSSLTANLNQWHHAVVTVGTGANSYTVYLDGIGESLANTASPNITNGDFELGRYSSGSTHYHDGLISDVRIYDQVLTQDQVREIYNNPGLTIPTGLSASNLRHRYKLETDYVDTGASGDDLTAFGSPSFTVNRPQLPRGLDLTGGFKSPPLTFDGDCVKLDGSTQGATSATTYSIDSSGSKTTIAGWALPRTLSGSNTTVFANVKDNSTDNFAIYRTGTNEIAAMADYGPSRELASAKNLDPNRWYFLAATFDYDTATLKFYVDGVEFSETPSIGFGGSTGFFEMGYRDNGGSPLQHFDGNLAHVMMIEDVLTQGEIVELMRDTSYAKAQTFGTVNRYYELDADFNDDTGSHNATSVGSPTFVNVKANPTRMIDPSRGAAMARVYTGRVINLDGSADYLTNTSAIPSIRTSGAKATICAWINTDTISGGLRTIAAFMNTGNSDGIYLNLYNAQAVAGVANGGGGAFVDVVSGNVTTNRWYFVAGVWDYDTASVTSYLDGVAGTGTPALGLGTVTGTAIGARPISTPITFFDGSIAGVKYFDVGLTQAQIRELYHNPEQVLPTGVSASNLKRYYPLSDYNDTGGTGGRYFQDMGADGEPVEDKGSASMEFAQPVPCPQLGLQQSATRHFFTGASSQSWRATVTAPGTTATLSGWMLWGDSSRTSYLAAIAQVTDAADSFNIRINAGFGDVTMYKAGEIDSGLNVNEGEWNHIVVTTKSTSPYWRCWVNGVEASSPAVAPVTNITTGFVYPGSNSTPFPLNGFINDVAFWDAELDTPDVVALYNSGVQGMDVSTVQSANLKGWWKADDLTTFKDYSGNGADAVTFGASGTIIGASFPENASGSTIVGDFSMKRKGVSVLNIPASTTNEQAIIPANQDVYPSFANGGSLSLFFRLEKLGTTSTIFINSGYGTTHERFAVYAVSSNKIQFELGDGASARANPQTTGTISDSDWHHFAMTVDYGGGSTTTIKLFIDGVLDSTSTATTLAGVPNASALEILNRGSGNEGKGPLACFKAYQVTLSDNEIKQIYNSDLRLIKGLANE